MTGDFWILESTSGYVRVHRGRCVHCKHGQGLRPGRTAGIWHGPFPSYAEALFKARKTGGLPVRDCMSCTPRGY